LVIEVLFHNKELSTFPKQVQYEQIADKMQEFKPQTRAGLRAMTLALFATEPDLATDPAAFGLEKATNTLLSGILHTLAA
jgi:hypothetical protein